MNDPHHRRSEELMTNPTPQPGTAEPYVLHVDDRGHKLTIHPLVIGAHGPAVVVTAPGGVPIPYDLQRMADRLAGLPYATKAAADTATVIEHLKAAQAHAEKLADVWYAVEWWDSGDWSEDQAKDALAKYQGEEGPTS